MIEKIVQRWLYVFLRKLPKPRVFYELLDIQILLCEQNVYTKIT